MMGTLASVLAGKNIPTVPEELYWADVEGDIEKVNGIPKITQIRATFHLKAPEGKEQDSCVVIEKQGLTIETEYPLSLNESSSQDYFLCNLLVGVMSRTLYF
jgi:hypothetical protein